MIKPGDYQTATHSCYMKRVNEAGPGMVDELSVLAMLEGVDSTPYVTKTLCHFSLLPFSSSRFIKMQVDIPRWPVIQGPPSFTSSHCQRIMLYEPSCVQLYCRPWDACAAFVLCNSWIVIFMVLCAGILMVLCFSF